MTALNSLGSRNTLQNMYLNSHGISVNAEIYEAIRNFPNLEKLLLAASWFLTDEIQDSNFDMLDNLTQLKELYYNGPRVIINNIDVLSFVKIQPRLIRFMWYDKLYGEAVGAAT